MPSTVLPWPHGSTSAKAGSALDQLMAANGFSLWANVSGCITWWRENDLVCGTIEIEMGLDARSDVEYEWTARIRLHDDEEGADDPHCFSTPEAAVEWCVWAMRVTSTHNGGDGENVTL